MSAWAANAVPVAEFTLGQILLANKGYFRNLREYTGDTEFAPAFRGRGNYDCTVALLGAGQIGRAVIHLLKPFYLQVLVCDPYLSGGSAAELGVQKVELDEAFCRGDIVSNHLADLPATEGLLRASHFSAMPHNATFINTGRGRTASEVELAEVLSRRPDLTALLDVTDPEPCPHDSPLRALPNVYITSHIAGAIGNEVSRLADYVIEEFQAWRDGRPLRYSVTTEMLTSMA
jgi:phosphoglycerate dehydrogenase-like enzyme